MVSSMNILVLCTPIFSLYYAFTEVKLENSMNNDTQRFESIIKSPIDARQYRGLKLKNELKVLLISDPTTDKSAASLVVSAGSLNEPKDMHGIAHFLEHMLFMGSKKYSQENDYEKFISEHAGYRNAYTIDKMTNFFFEISRDSLVPALDRFAQFFREPLMKESAMQREVMAVNSEHEKNINEDTNRVYQLEKWLSKPGHSFNNFTNGNLETLDAVPKSRGISVRDRLLEFHSKWYSANIMNLVVLGKESLDELENIVIKLFSDVKNKNVQRIFYKEHPYGPNQLKRKFYVVPIQDVTNLKISFSTPDVVGQYRTQPQEYISHLIGHKGPGSLYSWLREKELCNDLLVGMSPIAPGFAFFNITLSLNTVDQVDEIITIVFQYIQLLKTEGIQEWIFEENRKIEDMAFFFKDKETPLSYVTFLSPLMADFPFQDILTAYYLFDQWEPSCIKTLLSYLIPDNMKVIIESKSFKKIANLTERWYGVKYKVEEIPDHLIQRWKNVKLSDNLHLPTPNEFIPENFNIYPRSKHELKNPYILHESSISRIWFKQDEFKLPKLNVQFEIFSPVLFLSPSNCNLTEMFVALLVDALIQYAHSASLAGIGWNINTTENGILIELSGFNEKLPMLLKKFISEVTNFNFDEKRFRILKLTYIRSLKNFETRQPYTQAPFHLSYLMRERGWSKNDLLNATNVLEYSNLEKFVSELLSMIFIQGLIYGNCDKQKALDIVNIWESSLKSSSGALPQQLLLRREVKIDDGHHLSYEVFNNYHSNSCYYVYFQCSTESPFNNVVIELFSQIVEEPCYTILRTQEQLGYVVQSSIRRFGGVQGFSILIQSEKHPLYLNSRVEEFLRTIRKMLEEMTDEELKVHKTSLATNKLNKPEYLREHAWKYWNEISSQMYNFNRDNIEVRELQKLKKSDVLKFFKEFLQVTSPKRRKLSVNIISTVTSPEQPKDVPIMDIRIKDVTSFKRKFLPLPKPYIQITPIGTKPNNSIRNVLWRKRSFFKLYCGYS